MINNSYDWGLRFGALTSFVEALCITLVESSLSSPTVLLYVVVFVPIVTLMGGLAGGFLFWLVGILVALSRQRIEASALSYSLLASILSLGVIVPFASWLAGGILPALQNRQGVYLLLPVGLVPVAIAGCFVGAKVASEESKRPPTEGKY
jgi:hypothetical protein